MKERKRRPKKSRGLEFEVHEMKESCTKLFLNETRLDHFIKERVNEKDGFCSFPWSYIEKGACTAFDAEMIR